VLATLVIEPDVQATDLCCCDGLFTAPLAGMPRHVIAIDLDPEMLDKARRRLLAASFTNYDFVAGDAYDVATMAPAPIGFALIANTFHGVRAGKAQSCRSLDRPKGRFAVVNWHRRPRKETKVLGQPGGLKTELLMEPADVARAVEPTGLKLVDIVELPP
jgi:SAM-dependent methyltransferase